MCTFEIETEEFIRHELLYRHHYIIDLNMNYARKVWEIGNLFTQVTELKINGGMELVMSFSRELRLVPLP